MHAGVLNRSLERQGEIPGVGGVEQSRQGEKIVSSQGGLRAHACWAKEGCGWSSEQEERL